MIRKEKFLHKNVAEDVMENTMITVAGQMFIEYVKELDNLNQVKEGYEDYIGNKTI